MNKMTNISEDLKAVQTFIKDDDEYCPDYSVTKNVYIKQIQNVIDKHGPNVECIYEVGCSAMQTGHCALSHCPKFIKRH